MLEKELSFPENLTNEQLLQEIDRLLASENAEEMDADRLEACLALLQQRCPVMEDFDPQQAKTHMQAQHPELFSAPETPPKKRSFGWRIFPLAAALALLLAVCVGAYCFSSGWTFEYKQNYDPFVTGDRYAVTTVEYGGTLLPYESKQKIYDTMVLEEVIGGSRYVAEFTFSSLTELETFIGTDLVESDRLAVSDVHCTAYIHNETSLHTVSIKGFYTLVSDDYVCRVRFHLSTYPDAELSLHHSADETAYDFAEYPMDKLGINAAVLSSTTDKTDIDAYWTKDRLAYELHIFGVRSNLEHLRSVLDSLQ